ncbi:aspartate aminotransferase family protein [Salipaludibacillus neizhouensis]|uniref:Acetylornithine aminotransferase n=1 Tax=Salipaludibacillus neizhouensis TaxID=885475 RepID=A0A3A9KN24_9BACI|nr:acetylornithine transaminase [Salipaludibacillus neizhouensis]RKL69325.1 aspartate aminotransferase family protein [Salipaludibacillus neizhouensis]
MPKSVMSTPSARIMNTYQRFPITLVKGKGSYVWDKNDTKYLDYTSGIATCNLGHVPDFVQAKLHEQLDSLWHCSNLYEIPSQQALANILTENSVSDQVFFCNSGAEANEAAIKLAKKYAKDQGHAERTEIVTFSDSFHGRTGTTLAATAQTKIHEGFTPITPGFRYLPFNHLESLTEVNNGKTTAVLLELVQGEGGVRPADPSWIQELAKICKENDILFMVDEIQTGMGRTGTLFAYEQFNIEPDVITLAKGLGSGFPIGAMMAKEAVANSFQPGTHGSTFGGNPLATTAGLATIEALTSPDFLTTVTNKSAMLTKQLHQLKEDFPSIVEVRGMGLLIGIEFTHPVKPIMESLRAKKILVLIAGPKVLRILPPLVTTTEELELFMDELKHTIKAEEQGVTS